jgi:carbonic anhydrase
VTLPDSSSALASLQRLRDGNARYASNVRSLESMISHTRRGELAEGQHPTAIILGCSDSRVPAEVVFDQGLGDLFVIRVAGNIVAPSQIGSVEFAAAAFGTRLVVVMGHSGCGAISAAIQDIRQPSKQSKNIRSIVDRVRPSVQPLLEVDMPVLDHATLVHKAVRANVRASCNQLRHGSELLEQLAADEGLLVVGAEYSLETGIVEFFEGVPRDSRV